VGDSIAFQSDPALVHLAPAGTTVDVDDTRPGTAPCDWARGFNDPNNHQFRSFADTLRTVRPAAVAFVFTGNPGLSGPGAGCVRANSRYDLSQLMASYKQPLEDMANQAIRAGATVYMEAPPPRNPAVPTGYKSSAPVNLGFLGSGAIGTFYEGLVVAQNSARWQYDENAAAAVSTPSLTWTLSLPCEQWDVRRCVNGRVQVRAGGADPVHLDGAGCGAIRYALALEERPLHGGSSSTPPPDPQTVTAAVSRYGGCQ
jgi:hypothetical protein